jgi:sugar lactone lactonase YvrE
LSEIELVYSARDVLGEGPRWHPQEQCLYWLDIESRYYHRLHIATGTHEIFDVGELVGVIGFRERGGLVLASERGFSFFDPETRRLEPIGNPEEGKTNTQFNEGAVDRLGRFWAGTYGDPFKNSLYRLDPDLSIHRMDTGFDISNGMGWSPDNQVMYFTDSTPGIIYAYDYDLATGSITNRRKFVDRSGQNGVPDGLTVDADGFIWSAVWGGSCIERYDPEGKLERRIHLPVQCPTSMAFGGQDLDELYITSALYEIPKEERPHYPADGNLYRIKGIAKGIAEPKFAG